VANQVSVSFQELEVERERWAVLSAWLKKACDQKGITFLDRFSNTGNGYQQLNITRCRSDKILIASLFDLFTKDHFFGLARHAEQLGKKIYFLVDTWLDQDQYQHPAAEIVCDPRLLSLTARSDPTPRPVSPNRLYNAFVHRAEPVRQSWLYFLYLNDLLEQGFVSYQLFQIDSKLTGTDLFDHIHRQDLQELEQFNRAHAALRPMVPYRNFDDSNDLGPLVLQTKYSLVLDTFAPADDIGSYYISEKVTRALQYPTSDLLFVQRGTIKRLHHSGFYVDPRMLEIDNLSWIKRQQEILNILISDAINDSDDERYHQAAHNRSIMNSWLAQTMSQEFVGSVVDAVLHN